MIFFKNTRGQSDYLQKIAKYAKKDTRSDESERVWLIRRSQLLYRIQLQTQL